MKKLFKTLISIGFALLLLLSAGCKKNEAPKEETTAEAFAEEFIRAYESGDFLKALEYFPPSFASYEAERRGTSEEEYRKYLKDASEAYQAEYALTIGSCEISVAAELNEDALADIQTRYGLDTITEGMRMNALVNISLDYVPDTVPFIFDVIRINGEWYVSPEFGL